MKTTGTKLLTNGQPVGVRSSDLCTHNRFIFNEQVLVFVPPGVRCTRARSLERSCTHARVHRLTHARTHAYTLANSHTYWHTHVTYLLLAHLPTIIRTPKPYACPAVFSSIPAFDLARSVSSRRITNTNREAG